MIRRGAMALLFLAFSANTVMAGEKFALVITGASGGDAYAQKYLKWRVEFVETLKTRFAYKPDHILVLAENESEGVEKATRERVQHVFADLRKRARFRLTAFRARRRTAPAVLILSAL